MDFLPLVLGIVSVVSSFFSLWACRGLADDGAKALSKGLVRRRAERLPEGIRTDYLEMWLAELPHLSPPGQLLWVLGLFLTSSQKFKPLMAPASARASIKSPRTVESERFEPDVEMVAMYEKSLAEVQRIKLERIRQIEQEHLAEMAALRDSVERERRKGLRPPLGTS